jgi:lipopolysaccharide/colanic/teichoic acid biosynthesis glycosyltransferase
MQDNLALAVATLITIAVSYIVYPSIENCKIALRNFRKHVHRPFLSKERNQQLKKALRNQNKVMQRSLEIVATLMVLAIFAFTYYVTLATWERVIETYEHTNTTIRAQE